MTTPTLADWPERRGLTTPDAPAFVYNDTSFSYGLVAQRVSHVWTNLANFDVKSGSRVIYLGPNSIVAPELFFACARLGAIYVPVNTRLSVEEIGFILQDSKPSVLVWHEELDQKVSETFAVGSLSGVHLFRVGAGEPNLDFPFAAYDDLLAADSRDVVPPEIHSDMPLMIQYTSGTSGKPKGVVLTHANILWNVLNLLIDVDLTTDEVGLIAAPLFHTAGFNNHLLPIFLKGGTSIIVSAWRPAEVAELIEKHRVTCLLGVPTMFLALIQEPAFHQADISSVRNLLCGASPVPPALALAYQNIGLTMQVGYGLTETSPNATFMRATMAEGKPGAVGAPCFFVDVKIADDHGQELAVGESGEVLILGPNVTPGYWRLNEATEKTFTGDGWLKSGDIGYMDRDGYVYISDRKKDMIISGGENIYPAEVEAALYEEEGIAECAVVGRPDDRWGEVAVAFVVAKPGVELLEDEILTRLQGKIARYKVPKAIIKLDSLPHNASGKVLKRELRLQVNSTGNAES